MYSIILYVAFLYENTIACKCANTHACAHTHAKTNTNSGHHTEIRKGCCYKLQNATPAYLIIGLPWSGGRSGSDYMGEKIENAKPMFSVVQILSWLHSYYYYYYYYYHLRRFTFTWWMFILQLSTTKSTFRALGPPQTGPLPQYILLLMSAKPSVYSKTIKRVY